MERLAGVILHPSSFPNNHGIGNFGVSAYRFIDVIAESGFKLWQMCPLGPTSYGDSPYQCFSAFAGNPYFIDWNQLVESGFLIKRIYPSWNHFRKIRSIMVHSLQHFGQLLIRHLSPLKKLWSNPNN